MRQPHTSVLLRSSISEIMIANNNKLNLDANAEGSTQRLCPGALHSLSIKVGGRADLPAQDQQADGPASAGAGRNLLSALELRLVWYLQCSHIGSALAAARGLQVPPSNPRYDSWHRAMHCRGKSFS